LVEGRVALVCGSTRADGFGLTLGKSWLAAAQFPNVIAAPRRGVALPQRGARFDIPHNETAVSNFQMTAQRQGVDSLQGLIAL